jgi:hypothetical protein
MIPAIKARAAVARSRNPLAGSQARMLPIMRAYRYLVVEPVKQLTPKPPAVVDAPIGMATAAGI